MQFRLLTVLYVFALLAAGMAVSGGWGIFLTCITLLFWALSWRGKLTLLEFWFLVGIGLFLLFVMLPSVETGGRRPSRTVSCLNNLKQLVLGLELYRDQHGRLPSVVIPDEQGLALHSWRASLLPYLYRPGLSQRWRTDLPFDHPANTLVANMRLEEFACPSDPLENADAPVTNYFAVTGPETAWANPQGTKLEEITDPHDQTILLIEAAGLEVPWAEPRDLTFDEAVALLTGQSGRWIDHTDSSRQGFFDRSYWAHVSRINVAFVDGTVTSLAVPMPENLARAFLTANGGEDFTHWRYEYKVTPQPYYARIYGLCVFVMLALLPGFVLWRRQRLSRATKEQLPAGFES